MFDLEQSLIAKVLPPLTFYNLFVSNENQSQITFRIVKVNVAVVPDLGCILESPEGL